MPPTNCVVHTHRNQYGSRPLYQVLFSPPSHFKLKLTNQAVELIHTMPVHRGAYVRSPRVPFLLSSQYRCVGLWY